MVAQGLRVAVLGSTTADDLGIGDDGVGSTITIDGLPYTVVGILQAKGGTGFVRPGRPGPRAARHGEQVLHGIRHGPVRRR